MLPVNVDNVDEPVVNVELTHFDKDELYCNTLLLAGLDIITSDNIAKLSSSVELIHFEPFHLNSDLQKEMIM